MGYNFKQIVKAYKKIGIKRGDNVLVKSDLRYLGNFYDKKIKSNLAEAHFLALSKIINLDKGTITVSTASESICNTKIPFDINKTKSERGSFSELIRGKRSSVRSFHPFNSHTSIGNKAEFICKRNSLNSFGANTPKDRMLKCRTKYISIGLEPRMTCSYIHHAEMLCGVPYRYTKEFLHPIKTSKGIKNKLFYMFVCYKNTDLERNININLFKFMRKQGLKIRTAKLGGGKIYSYDCNKFVDLACLYLKENIYGWLTKAPRKRPYAK